jgi:hypothetical protein
MKILFITFLLFCYNNISEKNQIHINNFSSKQWIFDSLACDNYRDTAVYNLYKDKNKLISQNTYLIKLLLGNPNFNNLDSSQCGNYLYYIEKKSQCPDYECRNYIKNSPYPGEYEEINMLCIKFRNGIVIQVNLMFP